MDCMDGYILDMHTHSLYPLIKDFITSEYICSCSFSQSDVSSSRSFRIDRHCFPVATPDRETAWRQSGKARQGKRHWH